MKNNSILYICLCEILICLIIHVNSNQQGNKKYLMPKPNTKYITSHNIRHKHHYMNRTSAITEHTTYKKTNPTTKVKSLLYTSTVKKPESSGKKLKAIDIISVKLTTNDATLKKPFDINLREMTTTASVVLKNDTVNNGNSSTAILALTLKNKLLNNEGRRKLNDLSNRNYLPSFDSAAKHERMDRVHTVHHSVENVPYFDEYLQRDSPHAMQLTNKSFNGSFQFKNDVLSKNSRFVKDSSEHMDEDEDNDGEDDEDPDGEDPDDDEDDARNDEEDNEEHDIAMFDDELSFSTLTSKPTTTKMSSSKPTVVQEVNVSADISKLNMVRSIPVPYQVEYAASLKAARSPPSIESPTTEPSVHNLQRLASKHKNKVVRDAACRKPLPKVVKVSDVYPTASKIYVPQCTIIHQCAEDTGCCTSPSYKCGPKSSEKIDLYFYTYLTSAIVPGVSPHQQIEKLGFYNHTECECHEDMPRDDSNVIDTEGKNLTDDLSIEDVSCYCPTDFAVRRFLNGSCGCDCFDKERDCLRFKKGKEYFSLKDKWCIKTGKCHEPSCEFGKYSPKVGRCPRQNEKSRFF